jgi:hypothetical protein
VKRLIVFVAAGLLLNSCTEKYAAHSAVDQAFDFTQTYTVAIMPLLVRGASVTPGGLERDQAYGFLLRRLMETGKLRPIDKATVDRAVSLQGFGQLSVVSPAKAREIGGELGAGLVCLAEVTMDQESVVLATVDILDVSSTTTVYSGSAKATAALSTVAATESALKQATEKLVQKMK